VQHYFPTKEDLVEAAFDEANAQSSARIAAKVGDLNIAPPRHVLTVVLTELIPDDSASRTHILVRQAFSALALHNDVIAERMRAAYDKLHRRDIGDLLRGDQQAGRIPADIAPEQAAMALVALAEGLAYYVLVGVSTPATARDRILDAINELYRRPPDSRGGRTASKGADLSVGFDDVVSSEN